MYTPYYYTNVALTIKRLKDTDRGWEWGFLAIIGCIISGLLHYIEYDINNIDLGLAIIIIFFGLISLCVGLPIFIICGFYKGTIGPNKYGKDPLNSPGYITISDLNELFTTTTSSEISYKSNMKSFFSSKSKQIVTNWDNYKRNKEQRNLENSNLSDYQKWIITHPIFYFSLIFLVCAVSVILIFAII